MRKFTFSLRNILSLSFILLGGLPILVMGFIAIRLISADIDMEVRAKNLLIAQSLSSEVQAFLNDSISTLRLTEDIIIKKPYIKSDEINSYLDSILKNNFQFDSIVILDDGGTVKFMAPRDENVMGMNLSGQPFFSPIRQYRQPHWSSTFISPQTGKPTLTLAIPVSGGMIVGYVNLATLNAVTDRIHRGGTAYALIIDEKGTIIAHPDRNKVSERQNLRHLKFIGQEEQSLSGNFTYRQDDRDYLASLSPVSQTQWRVIVTVPADEAFAPVTRVRNVFAAGAVIVVFLAFAIAFLSLRKVSNPLSQLVLDARRIADGNYTIEEQRPSYKEIDALIDDFQRMAAAIKSREEALRENEEAFRIIFENNSAAMAIIERDTTISMVNDEYCKMSLYDKENLIGTSWTTQIPPEDLERLKEYNRKRLINPESAPGKYEFSFYRKDGEIRHSLMSIAMIPSSQKIICSFVDITDRKRAEKALEESEKRYRELSVIDDLTHLYNSRYFYHQLKLETDRVNRYEEQAMTLLFLDLDDFKQFNDAYGHIEGDQVLSRLGQVVKRCLRQADSAYRYGGEEFTIILPMTTSKDAVITAERIRTAFKKETFSPAPDQGDVHVTVSIGLGQYKLHEDMKAFVIRVDELMYKAKKNGKDRVCSDNH